MKRLVSIFSLCVATVLAQIPSPTDAPKPRTPEQSAAAFKLPAGFKMEIIASEPLLAAPSGICWDERGQMFVSELHGYNLAGQLDVEDLNKSGKLDTQVRRLQADAERQIQPDTVSQCWEHARKLIRGKTKTSRKSCQGRRNATGFEHAEISRTRTGPVVSAG